MKHQGSEILPLENVIPCPIYSLRLRRCIFMTFQVCSVSNTVVVVDEIGKMELFSQSFVSLVRELFSSPQATILATVPVTKQRPIPFVDELKRREDVTLIEVRYCREQVLEFHVSSLSERERLSSLFLVLEKIK